MYRELLDTQMRRPNRRWAAAGAASAAEVVVAVEDAKVAGVDFCSLPDATW